MSLDNGGELMPAAAERIGIVGDISSGAEFVLLFDYPRPPISANSRMPWQKRHRLTADIRLASKLLAHHIPHLDAIDVSLTWVVSDRRRRDGGENLAPTFKPMIDGLVDAGVVVDDDQAHVRRGTCLVEYRASARPHMVLRIRPVHPEPQEAAAA